MKKARDEAFVTSIADDVMKCLAGADFFAALDDRLCPADDSVRPERCAGAFRLSESVLRQYGFDAAEDIDDILAVLRFKGACCDCEVLYNVAVSSRLKTAWWRSRAAEMRDEETANPHHHSN